MGGEGRYIFDVGLGDEPFLRYVQIDRQQPPDRLHDRHALLLAETSSLQILHERKRVEMVHIWRRVQMRRFVLFRLLGCRGAHL